MLQFDENILFFAFKYALGRISTAPSIVASNILKNLSTLSVEILERMITEIQECSNLGMDIDKKTWNHICLKIKEEIELRKVMIK